MMLKVFKSFSYAINGLRRSIKTELNFKIHLSAAVFVVVAGWCFDISTLEWLALVICIGSVLAAELINTAIEALVNLVSPDFNVKAGVVKDIAAAAVLVSAIMSLVVGLIIFVPKIF